MPVTPSENGFTLKGIAPPDLKDYPGAAPTFWGWVVAIALKVKDRELAQGLDKDGKPLRSISAATRKHRRSAMTPTGKGDPSAPPLMPGRALSRTRSLLTGRAEEDHAEFWWRFDPWTGDSWARVLDIQAGHGRDVFGISEKGQRSIRVQAWNLWERLKKGRTIPALALPTVPLAPAAAFSQGKLTISGLEAHYRAPAKAARGRPQPGNVLLTHLFGEPPRPAKAAGGAVVPRPPKPEPITAQRVAMAPKPKPPLPKPKPKPPKPEAPKPAPVLTLPQFAEAVLRAARQAPESDRWRETKKVWIIDAYRIFIRTHPMDLGTFKDRLAEANRARLLTLARVDLPGVLTDDERIKEALSEVTLSAEATGAYHFIRI